MRVSLAVSCALAVFGAPAQAQEDASSRIAAGLQSYGPVPVTRMVPVERTRYRCGGRLGDRDCWEETYIILQPQMTQEVLTASGVRIVRVDSLTFGEPVRTSLPNLTFVDIRTVENCTGQGSPQQMTMGLAFRRSAAVQVTRTVQRTRGAHLNFAGLRAGPFTLSGGVSIQEVLTEGRVTTLGVDETVTRTRNVSFEVPPYTKIVSELRLWPIRIAIPFRTVAVVDADVSQNDRGVRLVSEVLPESARTFVIEGRIHADDASEEHHRLLQPRFGRADCATKGAGIRVDSLGTHSDTLWAFPIRRPRSGD